MAREPTERPIGHRNPDAEPRCDFPHPLHEIRCGELRLAALLALGVDRRAQERHAGDARNLQRILKREEQTLGGALVGLHRQHVLPFEQDPALRDEVFLLAGEHIGERRLARAVRAHAGMDLPLLDREIETVEDLLGVDLDVQVFDFKQRHRFLFHVDPSS